MPPLFKHFVGSFAVNIILCVMCALLNEFEFIVLEKSIILIIIIGNITSFILRVFIKEKIIVFHYEISDLYFLLMISLLTLLSYKFYGSTPQISAALFMLVAFLNVYIFSFVVFCVQKFRNY